MNFKIFVLLLATIITFRCTNAPDFPIEPSLKFVSYSKATLQQGRSLNDSLYMTLSFTDGDGDLGSDNKINLVIIDKRTGNNYDLFRVPKIPEAGANNGVSGTMRIKIYNTCCLEPNSPKVCEDVTVSSNELSFDIVLTDRAGHESNRLTTPVIQLECK